MKNEGGHAPKQRGTSFRPGPYAVALAGVGTTPTPIDRRSGPGVSSIRSTSRHRMPQPLKVAPTAAR